MKFRIVRVGAFVAFASVAILDSAIADTIKIGGSGGSIIGIRSLIDEYHKANPGDTITVVPNLGSGGGIKALAGGAINFSFSGRLLKDSEKSSGLQATAYAQTPIVFIVKKGSGVTTIGRAEIAKIFNGEQTKWPSGQLTRPILRPESESDSGIVRSLSPEINVAYGKALSRDGMIVAMTDPETAESLLKIPGAIGFLTRAQIVSDAMPVEILALDGVVPNDHNASTGKYPMIKTFYLIEPKQLPPAAKRFKEFIFSEAGKKILLTTGHIPTIK